MKEKAREPAIRFSEFAGAWEQRKFKNLYALNNERNTGLIGYEKTLSLSTMTYNESGNGAASSSLSNYKVLRVGDIAFEGHTNKKFRYGRFVLNDVGIGIMSPRFTTLRPTSKMPESFWKYYIHQEPIMRQKLSRSTKAGTMMNELVVSDFLNQDVLVPKENEQEVIGSFFNRLDTLITLHQRKYEQFLILKESMIQKLFPKDGEHAPEIRFSGCAGDWEQRLLGDIYLERNERGSKSLDILSVSIHSGISEKNLDAGALGKIVRRSEDKSLYKHVFPGDLVFNMMRAWQGALGVVKKEGMVSPAYISAIPNAEVYPGFMNYCLRRKNVINQINNLSYGVTDFRKRLYWDSFVKIKISLPSISEQKKITEFLTRLDAAINLHKRRLGMLKNVKQAFLEKMFI